MEDQPGQGRTRLRWKLLALRLERSAREGRKITLEEIEQKTGIRQATLSNIERNTVRGLRFETIEGLVDYFKITDLNQLLQIEQQPPNDNTMPLV